MVGDVVDAGVVVGILSALRSTRADAALAKIRSRAPQLFAA
ncbi:hypothetical protein ACIRRA_45630 [Nocardia sp. NPDC101769]